jgi:hypothetical protein
MSYLSPPRTRRNDRPCTQRPGLSKPLEFLGTLSQLRVFDGARFLCPDDPCAYPGHEGDPTCRWQDGITIFELALPLACGTKNSLT